MIEGKVTIAGTMDIDGKEMIGLFVEVDKDVMIGLFVEVDKDVLKKIPFNPLKAKVIIAPESEVTSTLKEHCSACVYVKCKFCDGKNKFSHN